MINPRVIDPTGKMDVQIFEGWATVDLLQWRTWIKPRGKTMASIFALSSGGGGGGGFIAAAAAARGGGGGGSSGTQGFWTGPLFALPNVLSIQAGAGGAGGAGSGAGGAGMPTRIAIAANSTAAPTNMVMNLTASVGGGAGTGAAGGSGGIGPGAPAISASPLAGLGAVQFLGAATGAAGGAQTGAVGANTTITATGLRAMAGAGGAGVTAADFAGGGVTAITDSWLSESRPIAPAAGSNSGSGGFFRLNPFWSWPGLGGSASNSGVGGAGGPGSFGSGGGGGGGGITGGSLGGAGGPGLVIIICW